MLLDNKNNRNVGEELKKQSFADLKLSVFSTAFTLYGFYALQKELSMLKDARIFFTNWQTQSLQNLIGNEHELRLINQLDQKHIASVFSD